MNNEASFILHNETDTHLKRSDYIKEMCRESRCLQCKTIIQKAHSLLNEMTEIKKNEVVGVCEYCKRLNPSGKCKRCEYLAAKFFCCKATPLKDKEERLKSWLYKAVAFLQSLQKCENICRNRLYGETTSMNELEKLLQELGSSLNKHKPDINVNPKIEFERFSSEGSVIQYKKALEELVFKTESESKKKLSSNDSLYVNPSVFKKQGDSKKSEAKIVTQVASEKDKKTYGRKKGPVTEKKIQTKTIHRKKQQNKTKAIKEKQDDKSQIQLKILPLENEGNAKTNVEKDESEDSASVVQCEQLVRGQTKMIEGAFLVRFDPHYKDDFQPDVAQVPQSFHVEVVCEDQENVMVGADNKTIKQKNNKVSDVKTDKKKGERGFLYELSNPAFIYNGWTIMPKLKQMKRIHIFKMEPACPQFDWFEHNKHKKVMYYDCGEKLAEIGDDGHGQWFYKNGNVALDFYDTKDLNEGQRYVVFSSGDDVENGKVLLRTVLASFDYNGNGVVYDKHGNERLKYNQHEGILRDEKVGPPTHWKWHSLNDPPELKTVCNENVLDISSLKQNEVVTEPNDQNLAKEYAKIVLQNREKGFRKIKRYQIRMKVLKINDKFSLRILDQANVYLLFRDNKISLKLNLGMILIDTEIIGTETGDFSDVVTPYDHFPPHSQSVADIQETLRKVRKNARVHVHAERHRCFLT